MAEKTINLAKIIETYCLTPEFVEQLKSVGLLIPCTANSSDFEVSLVEYVLGPRNTADMFLELEAVVRKRKVFEIVGERHVKGIPETTFPFGACKMVLEKFPFFTVGDQQFAISHQEKKKVFAPHVYVLLTMDELRAIWPAEQAQSLFRALVQIEQFSFQQHPLKKDALVVPIVEIVKKLEGGSFAPPAKDVAAFLGLPFEELCSRIASGEIPHLVIDAKSVVWPGTLIKVLNEIKFGTVKAPQYNPPAASKMEEVCFWILILGVFAHETNIFGARAITQWILDFLKGFL